MSFVTTKSFTLAIDTRGNPESEKIAIVLPGRLDTKDYWNFRTHIDLLASKGFYSICFDPPGTWGSQGGIELFTTTNYIKAVNELIKLFGNRPTLLVGHSRGGQVAMLTSISNPKVSGFISINGSFEPSTYPSADKIVDGSLVEYRDLPPGNETTTDQKKFKLPMSFFVDGEQYRPQTNLKSYQKPKLIIYSTRDRFNDPEEVLKIFDQMLEPKMDHKLDCEHDYRRFPASVREINQIIGIFVDKFLAF